MVSEIQETAEQIVDQAAPSTRRRQAPTPKSPLKNTARLHIRLSGEGLNRFWLRETSEPGEHVWGGEQFSHFNLAGRRFPMWTQEPGKLKRLRQTKILVILVGNLERA